MTVDFKVDPLPPEPKPNMVDVTDDAEIMAAVERGELKDPRGGWYDGRFLVYTESLAQFRGKPYKVSL